jgi:hypothetical protein
MLPLRPATHPLREQNKLQNANTARFNAMHLHASAAVGDAELPPFFFGSASIRHGPGVLSQ